MTKKGNCKYCNAIMCCGSICGNCKAKLSLIRKIRKMLRPAYNEKLCRNVSADYKEVNDDESQR